MKTETFLCRQFTYGGKSICMGSCQFLKGMLRNHIQLPGFLVAIQMIHLAVEGLVVTCNGSTHRSGMSGKYSTHCRLILFQIEQSSTGLPLMKVGYQILLFQVIVPGEAINGLTGCIAKQGRFYIVPLPTYGVQIIGLPEYFEYFIFTMNKGGEIEHHSYGTSGNLPTSDPHPETLPGCLFSPIGEQAAVLLKFRMLLALSPNIRAYGDILICQLFDNIQCFGRDHGMNPSHFITYFPTNLK